jgi:branched-chain amino acid transport system substrate-binding protein
VLALSAVAACGGSAAKSDSGSGGGDTVKIGMLASLSGTYKSVGEDLRDGFQLYLDGHGGKLGGRKVDLVVADEGDGAATAVPAATKLVKQDKVVAMTGVVGGGSVNAVLPLLNENKIPLVGSNARPEVKDVTRVWHTSYMSDEPGIAIAQYLKETVPGPVYAIGPDYQGGWDELRGFTETFTKAGGQLANPDGKTKFTPFPQTNNFLPYFTEIKNSGAKGVYTFYAGAAAIDFVKQYRQSDAKDIPLYAAGFITEGGVLQAQGEAAKDVYTSLHYAPDLDNPTNRAFVAAYQGKFGKAPTSYVMASYDAAAVLDKGLAGVKGKVTPESLNEAIGKVGQIDSPRGTWQFGPQTHAPVQKWYLRQVRPDGRALSNVMVQDLATLGR